MSAWRVFACLSLVSLLGLTGCAVHPPAQLYQLDVGAAAVPKKDGGAAVLLGPVQLADYLKRDVMVQRQADGILSLSTEARWAGNLETNVSQQLLRQMSSELGSSRLALFPEKPGFTPQVQVMLTISRLDSGPKQPAVIEARWRLLDQKGDLKDSRVFHEEEQHQGSIGDQIRAQSDLLKRLAATARKPVAKPKVKEEEGPK
ncbi:hypothetical protein CDO47_35105, partial [Pseudomonas aeruginosa]|uniref:PqiC family protein n=1 Tax=Pseudomonas aeruginosa TaxID=287 RepID=UPI000B416CAE